MIRLSDLLGSRVVSRATAEPVGEVNDVVVDPRLRRILALQVGKGRKARLADWGSLSGVGPDAVVVSSEEALRGGVDDREERTLKGDISLIGARVLTDRGDSLGAVVDLELDEATGNLGALQVESGPIDADRLLAVGSYAVVVRADGTPD